MGRRRVGSVVLGAVVAAAIAAAPAGAATFSNPTRIYMDPFVGSAGPFLPYPSGIAVSGQAGTVTSARATLHAIAHGDLDEMAALLVGPGGQHVLLLSGACSGQDTKVGPPVTFTFDDNAATLLPQNPPCVSGTFKPTNYGAGGELFFAPAPPDPYPGRYPSALSVFGGTSPNGLWQLFVTDNTVAVSGSIDGGWSLELTTTGAAAKKCKKGFVKKKVNGKKKCVKKKKKRR